MAWDLEEAITYYARMGAPADQSAVIALLREVQQEQGGAIPEALLPQIAEKLGAKQALLTAIIRRIPSLRLSGKPLLELCVGPNCGKHTALAALAEELERQGRLTLRFLPCQRMCGKGPNLRWNGVLHHRATESLLRQLLEE